MANLRIEDAVLRLSNWMTEEALPLWADAGFDSSRGSFVERLTFAGEPLSTVPRRSMVQARQVYVYSHAALLGLFPAGRELALRAAHNLIDRYLGVDGEAGWIFAAHPDGRVQDARRDFYAHAFALFGLAWAYRLEPDPKFLAAALETLRVLDTAFASPGGGYFTRLPADLARRDQNPHMHLFEAMIAWSDSTNDGRFLARAGELYSMMAARFFQTSTGILPEYYDGYWVPLPGPEGRICEPGHHYEWSWLLRGYAVRAGKAEEPIAPRLKAFADAHGYDASGLVVDELFDDGRVHKASRRCWPHTEAIKAEVAAHEAGDLQAGSRAARLISRLNGVFLGHPVAGGWIDHIDAEGRPLVDYMPASTLYHVFLAVAEARRVWGAAR